MKITEHFSDYEFKCKCGCGKNLIKESHVKKLEQLFQSLKCGKAIVSSGYRCSKHDKTVGGTGTGQHTLGLASDVTWYDKANKIIKPIEVAKVAEKLGFMGIGLLNNTVHLDNRTNGKWYACEITGKRYTTFQPTVKKCVTCGQTIK